MSSKYFLTLLLLLALIPWNIALAEAPSPKRIAAIESTNSAWNDIRADFEQKTYVELIDKTVTKHGTMRLKKGGRLYISYKGNDKRDYISDGTTLWIFVPGDSASLQTYAVNNKSIPKEALSFMTGFGKLRKEFKVSTSSAFPGHPGGSIALHLVPRSGRAHFKSLDALFGPGNLLSEIIISNVSGNQSHYTFRNIKTNQNPPDDLFTLTSNK